MELLPLVCLCLLSCSGDGVRVVVEQDRDAVLNCLISNKEDITGKLFVWKKDGQKEVFTYDASDNYPNRGQDQQFKGRVSHFQDQLKNGNASIKITRTKMADSGTYSCEFPRLQSQTSITELVVGTASEPSVSTLLTPEGTVLQCKVRGASPKPKVEWKDSSGNILPVKDLKETESGGLYNIVLKAALTKMDNFRCVVTQEEISHQIYADIALNINGAASEPYVTTIETDEGRMLQCKVLGASPKPEVEWKDSSGNVLPVKDLKETENGGLYDIVLQAAVTKTDNFRCVVTQEGSDSPLSAEIHAVTGSNTGMVIVGVVCSLLLGVGIGCCLAVLYMKHRNKQNRKKGSTPVAANGQPDANEGTTMIESE